jgi:tetratricopeptide (TPR) repeat protein
MTDELESHPEDLIDRLRRGTLTEAERERLDAHLEACVICRLEIRLREDFAAERRSGGDDAALIARSIDGVELSPPERLPRKRRRHLRLLLAAAALLGIAAAASLALRRPPPEAPPPRAPELAAPAVVPVAPRVEQPRAQPAPEPAQPEALPDPKAPRTPASSSVAQPAAKPSAAELFARANAERRAGAIDAALGSYQQLAREYPASREALTSRVAVGRLLLDARGNASGALREFDAYLAQSPAGTLAEEALAGRALSYQRLGRTADERSAWSELLQRFPNTVHRERAEQRLAAP